MNRKLDNLNRITIPKEILDRLDIASGDELEITVDRNDNIVLTRIERNKNTSEILDKIEEYKKLPTDAYNQAVVDTLNWVLNIGE